MGFPNFFFSFLLFAGIFENFIFDFSSSTLSKEFAQFSKVRKEDLQSTLRH